MAMKIEEKLKSLNGCNALNKLSVEDLDVIEDSTSGSDSDDDKSLQKAHNPDLDIATIPSAINSVAITNSENVHFGNKTYFNGPVTIKQFIQAKSGIENEAYIKTDGEETPAKQSHNDIKSSDTSRKKNILRTWHKVVLSFSFVVLSGIVCSIVFSLYAKSFQDETNKSSSYTPEHGTTRGDEVALVEGIYVHYPLLLTLVIVLLTLLLMLLTKFNVGVDTNQIYHHTQGEEYTDIDRYKHSKGPPQIIASYHLRIVNRSDWLAQPVEKPLDVIEQPVPWVIIAHTATEKCESQSECVLRVRLIQSFHIESRGWYDIGYNFLVGGDGSAYWGRGWDYVGAHTKGYNTRSMGIAFIGTFNNEPPPQEQIDACLKLIKMGVALGKIAKDYKLLAHRQLMSTLSPGDKLYDLMKSWPQFATNFTEVL